MLRIEDYDKRGAHLRPVFRIWKSAIDAFPEPSEDHIEVLPDQQSQPRARALRGPAAGGPFHSVGELFVSASAAAILPRDLRRKASRVVGENKNNWARPQVKRDS